MKKLIIDVKSGKSVEASMSAAEVAERKSASDAEESRVPDALTPAQFWMQLAVDGDEAAALAIIDTLPRVQQLLALRARDYRRDNELLIQLATALQKDSAAIDAFFRDAITL